MNKKYSLFHVPIKREFQSWEENDNETKVINIKRDMDREHFYVGRGSVFGNPFSHKESKLVKEKTNTREEAVRAYYNYIIQNKVLLENAKELYGKTLGCFCHGKMCHADVLALIADCAHIGQPIENNYSFNGMFVITESQYDIMDERRLALLSEIHESKFILLKKKGPLSGFLKLEEKNSEIDLSKDSIVYNKSQEKSSIEVHFENAHYLQPIFSIEDDLLNFSIVAKNQKGIFKKVF